MSRPLSSLSVFRLSAVERMDKCHFTCRISISILSRLIAVVVAVCFDFSPSVLDSQQKSFQEELSDRIQKQESSTNTNMNTLSAVDRGL